MKPSLEQAIQQQWAADEEYVATCRFIELDLEAAWEIEARIRSASAIRSFVEEKLRQEWREVSVIPTCSGGQELSVRREQPLTLDAVQAMNAGLLRLAHTYDLDWLNWSEFDGHLYRSLHRTPLGWTFPAAE